MIGDVESQDDHAAVFMAGTPGAGKTEVATALSELYVNIIRIDADEFRAEFPGYTGDNSDEFQRGASWLVEFSYTKVIERKLSFILDGTFAFSRALTNVERAIHHNFQPTIYFVYQDPIIAWQFTKERERTEGRYIPKDVFIEAYFKSRENIALVKAKLGDSVDLHIVIKDYQNRISEIISDANDVETVLQKKYTKEELEELLDD
ncbi:zeta toxin family protein [Periweissella cryptocerci]|uniref:zeta toxin family protein n=1 Tax=Periweissella cryptocerci TaxID=2506420 RepID=UPI0026BA5D3A